MQEEYDAVHIDTDYRALGDQLCVLAAAREYARRNPRVDVYVSLLPEVVAAYGDDLVRQGRHGRRLCLRPAPRLRGCHREGDVPHYLGGYLAELGITPTAADRIELPPVVPPCGLVPGEYLAIQPYSQFARNPENASRFVSILVSICREECPTWPVVAVGRQDTPRDAEGVCYEYLGDALSMLRTIRHAAAVLTPRSASAHIAAAYKVSAFVWLPSDGENWHLDYRGWPHHRAFHQISDLPRIGRELGEFLGGVRTEGGYRQG